LILKQASKMGRQLVNLFLLITGPLTVFGQVSNEVQVYVRPGTTVHVNEPMTNTATGNFEVGDEGLLYVDGTLTNNGSMTFNNASSLMRGSTGNDGTGSGTYYVKRQGSSNSGVYNYWSSPMQSFSGVPGSQEYLYNPALGTQSYTDDTPADPGWVSHSGAMTPGRGYAGRGGGLATFTGDVNNGNVNYNLYYTADIPGNTAANTPFNLVGNPYPSGVSCASLVTANTDISGALYFWDDDLSGGTNYSNTDYAVWNGTGSLGTGSGSAGAPNGIISTGQGFKVKAISPGAVLNFTNSMRVTNTSQFFRMSGEESRLYFSIEGNNYFNQILIGILNDATDGVDRLYDATKMRGNHLLSLAAQQDEEEFCIMAFPPPSVEKVIPLTVVAAENGTYTFTANTMENFNTEEVYFVDTRSGIEIQLEEGTEIPVSIKAGEFTDRFYLNFRAITDIEEHTEDELLVYSSNGTLHLLDRSGKSSSINLQVLDLGGRIVYSNANEVLSGGVANVPLQHIASGIYIATVLDKETYSSNKVFIR
jgi:hypothetical protein